MAFSSNAVKVMFLLEKNILYTVCSNVFCTPVVNVTAMFINSICLLFHYLLSLSDDEKSCI